MSPTSDPLRGSARPTETGRGWALGLAAAAAAVAAAFFLRPGADVPDETGDPNWAHVRDAGGRPPGGVRWVGADGALTFLAVVPLADADRDVATTQAVREALAAGDVDRAERVIAAAQGPDTRPAVAVPPPSATPRPAAPPQPKAEPVLTEGLRADLRRGDADFFHIYLRDSCIEDGDVVEILLNGKPFRTITLTRRGATLSVPVAAGTPTTIQVRGVFDGGGGITVACRTSRGEGFMRAMEVGEVETLAVARK